MRRWLALAIVVLASAGAAGAHGPATAIGRAVEALGQVGVSYDPGAAVSEVEAGNFPQIVGPDVTVAFLPTSAADEILGGPDAVASEIAREAKLDGTLVVLVGARLGAWSADVGEQRLAELEREASSNDSASLAAAVERLVRSVQAEPKDRGLPWGWIAAALSALAVAALFAADRLVRRRP
jgi:hypothetical protein